MRLDGIQKLLAPLRARVANMVARAVVRLVDDSPRLQALQIGVLADETRDAVERFQQYGVTSVPFDGAEAVVVFVGGRRDHGLAVAVDDRRYRMKGLQQGEVALYTDEGDYVKLQRGRVVVINAGTRLSINAPAVNIGGGSMQPVALATAIRTELDAIWTQLVALGVHTHTGVTTGSGTSGTSSTGPITKAAQSISSTSVNVRT